MKTIRTKTTNVILKDGSSYGFSSRSAAKTFARSTAYRSSVKAVKKSRSAAQ